MPTLRSLWHFLLWDRLENDIEGAEGEPIFVAGSRTAPANRSQTTGALTRELILVARNRVEIRSVSPLMPKLKSPVPYETTFGTYLVDEQLGEGGAGRVYGGVAPDRSPVAIKVLTNSSADKRARFQNEIAFLQANRHPNIVTVIDHGLAVNGKISFPFYVMPRYEGSMRNLLRKRIAQNSVLPFFSQVLDGVEAAHLKGVVHRDLKPENILYQEQTLAIADFGTARFTEDLLIALVQTGPADRLANFLYAAPEQRVQGAKVTASADIYALGLMLNEMFTGAVPHGTDYVKIGAVSQQHEYLDPIVERMLRQSATDRLASISDVKTLLIKAGAEALSLQRISTIDQAVIKVGEIDEPLAFEPPKLIAADWNGGVLRLTLDRPVTRAWIQALQNMGNFSSVMGKTPSTFSFSGDQATVGARENEAQRIIDFFKQWLPAATQNLRHNLEAEVQRRETQQREKLRQERVAEQQRIEVNSRLRI